MNSNVLGLRNNSVSTRNDNTNNNYSLGFIKYNDNRQQIILYNTDLNYNPSTQTLNVPNIDGYVIGGSSKIDITETTDNIYYFLTFIDSTGTEKILRANTSGISYNPYKDELNVSNIIGTGNCDFLTFTGDGNGLTNLRSDELDNNSITIGTTNITLGSTATSLTGLTSLSAGGLTLSVNSLSNGIIGLTFSGTDILTIGYIILVMEMVLLILEVMNLIITQ
jgi:hypothetical protein